MGDHILSCVFSLPSENERFTSEEVHSLVQEFDHFLQTCGFQDVSIMEPVNIFSSNVLRIVVSWDGDINHEAVRTLAVEERVFRERVNRGKRQISVFISYTSEMGWD